MRDQPATQPSRNERVGPGLAGAHHQVVKRVARDLLVNDEAEIGDVVRRRLFDDLGKESIRRAALTHANWCFDHGAELLPEVTAVDRAATETGARDFVRAHFEQCYPFHPSTLTVFQRKWRSLSQFQQTRGTLAMFAQWVSIAFSKEDKEARREALITLGSAPLHVREFRSVVLGQLGEVRLDPALNSHVAGAQNKAATLDADLTKGPLKDLHRRVGTTILFESSGGQSDQAAGVPELRFALGEPEIDTTSIDKAASALEGKAFYIRKAGTDAYRFSLKPKLEEEPVITAATRTIILSGAIPPELWNKIGIRLIPRLRANAEPTLGSTSRWRSTRVKPQMRCAKFSKPFPIWS